MSLENQRLVTVYVDWPGLGALGTFDKRSGGNAGSENTKYPPGGMEPEISLGGRQTTEDVTAARLYKRERDRALIGALLAARGVASMSISDQALDRSKNPYGDPVTFTGTLGEVQYPDADSESDDAALLTLVMNADAGIVA